MAADTVPAAVPEPNDPARTGTQNPAQPGLLASMFAAVEPARPAFNLTPTPGAGMEGEPVTGASSAAYHPDPDAAKDTKTAAGSGARQPQGVVRAWLLAGAERWRRGAGSGIKRLEVEKARAQAHQVKESRTVAEKVNRSAGSGSSGGAASGGRSSAGTAGSGGGKSLARKAAGGGGAKQGPRNTSGTSRTPAPGPTSAGKTRTPRPSAATSAGSTGTPRAGKDSRATAAHGTTGPRTAKAHGNGLDPKPTKHQPSKTTVPGPATDGKTGKAGPAGSSTPEKKASGNTAGGKATGPDKTQTPGQGTAGGKDTPRATDGNTKAPENKTPSTADTEKKTPASSKATDSKTQPEKQPTTAGPSPSSAKRGKPFTTRESRATGYRDGIRAGKATAHVRAYGDGFKDGWGDVSEAAGREKKRLDTAHAHRKQQQSPDQKDQPVPPTQPTATVQPVQVQSVDATDIHLGDGATRERMSRGEVRTLKGFERRLTDKSARMTEVADGTKSLKARAEEQAKKVLELVEAARAVKGGDKLTTALARLLDNAQAQVGKAEDVHKRAVRAAEACQTLLTNTETRYGGIYQAVVDSPETVPAELAFYQEK